jgi:hypothetical protein
MGEMCCTDSGLVKANTTWEDWIFEESQRRYA